MSSLEKCLFRSFVHFLIRFFFGVEFYKFFIYFQQITSAGEDVEIGTSFAQVVGMQTGSSTMESSRYLKKLKMDLPFDPAIPLLEIYPKEPKILI